MGLGRVVGCKDVGIDVLVSEIRRRVIEWEREHWVAYPWRVERTPYKVLVAEVLLRRTTRWAVAREFPRFIQRFPDIYAVYSAPIEEVEEAFRRLGLYRRRATELKELAKAIVERCGGRIPDRWEDLVQLPGIGIYSAGAILSFGYGKKAPVLDSNVARLLTRLMGLETKRQEDYLKVLWRLVPDEDHEHFNYGLIDLGALICHYRQPRCRDCPLNDLCAHHMKSIDQDCATDLEEAYRELLQGAQRKSPDE